MVLLEAMLAVVVKGGEKIRHSHPFSSFLLFYLSLTHMHTNAICVFLRSRKPKFSSSEMQTAVICTDVYPQFMCTYCGVLLFFLLVSDRA